MNLNRRQVLLFLGSLGAVGLIPACRERLIPTDSQGSQSQPQPEPTAQPSPTPIQAAPAGFFAPVKGDVRWVVISDLNNSYGSNTYESQVGKAMSFIPDWQPDLVLCSGDMVAGQKVSLSDSTIQAMWEGFDQTIAAPLQKFQLPFAFTLGNHDASGNLSPSGEFIFQRERDFATAYWEKIGIG
ncbi:MAG: hypothetical protein HC835_14765 [Oscillatoriales cyanobacterium RM2_1_1]|nr:hypothetical protein [Oscillatoriales cyanobacterium RM2_1_1]